MQQEKRRPVFRASLSVKDREPIYLYRAIERWVFHGTFPSVNLGRQLDWCKHVRNHQRHAGGRKQVNDSMLSATEIVDRCCETRM